MNRNGVRQKSERCPTEIGISVRQPPEYARCSEKTTKAEGFIAWVTLNGVSGTLAGLEDYRFFRNLLVIFHWLV